MWIEQILFIGEFLRVPRGRTWADAFLMVGNEVISKILVCNTPIGTPCPIKICTSTYIFHAYI